MIQQFINREEELKILEERFNSKKPEFIVVYGRRRVGKTELAVHFMRNKPGIYFLAGEKAKYEIIKDEEPYYGEVPGLKGVWASGKTLEECRRNLAETVEEWIIIRLKKGHMRNLSLLRISISQLKRVKS